MADSGEVSSGIPVGHAILDHSHACCFLRMQAVSQYLAAGQRGRASGDPYSIHTADLCLRRRSTVHGITNADQLVSDGIHHEFLPDNRDKVLISADPLLYEPQRDGSQQESGPGHGHRSGTGGAGID